MKNVLYVVENKNSAQFRYRVLNVIEALENSDEWNARYVMNNNFKKADLEDIDLLVILRQAGRGGKILEIIKMARAAGIKILFDLDDLIFDYRDLPLLMRSTNSKNVFYWMGYFYGIRRIAKKVDGFITTNEFLAGKLKRSFTLKKVVVISNSLNREQVEFSEKCLKNKKHEGFTIGYFSGSPTHAKDLGMVEGELIRFLNEHEDVKMMIVGYMKFSSRMQEMISQGKIIVKDLMEPLKMLEEIAKVDVNIAPLLISDFTNSKSELKFFEAGAVETTTIASPSFAFSRAISDEENGLLAKPGEWYKKIKFLYDNPGENRKMEKKARKTALEDFYGAKIIKKNEEAYDEVCN